MVCEIVHQNANVTPEQVLCRIADRYLAMVPPSTQEELNEFRYYLEEIREALVSEGKYLPLFTDTLLIIALNIRFSVSVYDFLFL